MDDAIAHFMYTKVKYWFVSCVLLAGDVCWWISITNPIVESCKIKRQHLIELQYFSI